MTSFQVFLCVVFALSLALGQTLFKLAALSWESAAKVSGPWVSIFSKYFFLASLSYALTALLWMYILRGVPLTKAYVFSIAGAALVPLIGFLVFKEPVGSKYFVGFALMLGGVFLCVV